MTLPVRARRVVRSIRQSIPTNVVLGRRSAGDGPAEFIPLDEIAGAQLDAITDVQGSILYRSAGGWVGLPPGTAGQVLETQGAGADPLWADASAGGAQWWFDPPVAADFTQISEGAGVSGVSSTDDADVGLVLQATIATNDHASLWMQTAPATPFTVTTRVLIGCAIAASINAGLCLRDATTGLRTIFGADLNADLLAIRRATGTTFNAQIAGNTFRSPADGLWLRAVVTTDTDIVYRWSADGKTWHDWQTNTANGQVSGLDQIGFAISRRGAAGTQSITVGRWEIT